MLRSVAAVAAMYMAVASAPALAADWRLGGLSIGAGNRSVTYIDTDSLRDVRGKIRFRSDRYLERLENGITRRVEVSEVDCTTMQVTRLRARLFQGRALVAMINAPREENLYSSTSGDHWIVRRVCERNYLSGPVNDREEDCGRMFAAEWAPLPGRLAFYVPAPRPDAPQATQMAAAAIVRAAGK